MRTKKSKNTLKRLCLCMTAVLITSIGLYSCKNENKSIDEKSEEPKHQEVILNEYIQNTFFGVSFGANKDYLIRKFKENGLILDGYYSSDSELQFNKRNSYGVDFGGVTWPMVSVAISNNKFYGIRFYNAYETEEGALSSFEGLLRAISSKYHVYENPDKDFNTYREYVGGTNNHQVVVVRYLKGETFRHEIVYYLELVYIDFNYKTNVSEL